MKCVCDRAALSEALAATSSVALTRTPKEILKCVKLTAEADVLTLTAYDLEVGLRYQVPQVEVQKKGETLVACDRLMSIIRESADETMTLEIEGDHLHIRGRDSHFQIVGQNIREFPPVPEMEGDPDFVVKVDVLQQATEMTLFAAARENTRYAINGVLWEKEGKRLQLVATDGRRMAMKGASLEKSVGDDVQAIVPAKTMGLLGKLHFDPDETLEVKLSSNQVVMRSERVSISSVLVEGRFPNYRDVLPRDQDKKIPLKTPAFLSAVKRASLLANVESKGIRLKLGEEGQMTLSSRTPEQGEAEIHLKTEYNGESGLEIGFNPEFLMDALKVCDDTATLELKDASKPGMIRSGSDFQYVVMPVNLS